MSIEGIRVVRGSDWSQGDTDGGEGHVGTVSKVNTDHTVVVQWDMGNTTRCRTGKGDKCDLRILDSAPAGVRHNGFACDGSSCKQSIFSGTRWRCSQCSDFDLCSSCYFKDKHNIQHTFFRFDAPGMDGVLQPKRSTRERIRSWGTFEDATVERGPDWEYSDHDGGKGAVGTVVVSVSVPDNHAAERNVVTVRWHKKETIGHYRLGCDGKVDVLCVEAAPGNDYYTEHLMPLNTNRIHPETTLREMQSGTGVDCVAERKFQKGDKVCIQLPKVALKEAQKGHGGWNLHMNNNIGQHGEVKDVEENGDVLATFDGKEWHLSSGAVCKVPVVNVGDIVRIVNDEEKAQAMQRRHGGWISAMAPTLGKAGKVVKIDSNGDVTVSFGNNAFVYNAACCVPAPGEKPEDVECDVAAARDGDDKEDISEQLAQLAAQIFAQVIEPTQAVEPQKFVKAASNNDSTEVLAMLKAKPNIVNKTHQGLTALIIASHEGHSDVVSVLLKEKADVDATDDNGNTALMAALMN